MIATFGCCITQVDHLVDARPAIAEIAGDDQLADREVAHDARGHPHQLEIAVVRENGVDELLEERRLRARARSPNSISRNIASNGSGMILLDVLERVPARELADHSIAGACARNQQAPRRAIESAAANPGLARVVEERRAAR